MPWVTGEEWKALDEEKESVAREKYTWHYCVHDLAMGTHLTIFECQTVVNEIKESQLHPYDAFPQLEIIFDPERQTLSMRARALRRLLAESYGLGRDHEAAGDPLPRGEEPWE